MRAMRWLIPILIVGLGGAAWADFKNLKVLPKTISKSELKTIMKAQSKALGVECDYCHDVPDMASDKLPHKETARKMMQMTAAINAQWIKGWKGAEKHQVTCGTCHRGHSSPPPFVPPAGEK